MGRTTLRKIFAGATVALLVSQAAQAQPKLVVQVIVDQMRAEYLQRFHDQFEPSGGFRTLLDSGFNYANTHYNYIPTYTGPGHASVSTGTTPKYHGIVGNDWLTHNGYEMYCAEDTLVHPVGTDETTSQRSPRNLRALTFSDAIRLYTNRAGKSFGVSVKDRGAIFPAGHFANGAFWLDGQLQFVTSDYYMEQLPKYVRQFNNKDWPKRYAKRNWELELDRRKYTRALDDENPFEPEWAQFPYRLKQQTEAKGLGALKTTPFGNSLVLDMALELMVEEDLGKDEHTDFLGISFSSPDYIGHAYGARSLEVNDTYVKLDKDLATLIAKLDQEVGREHYVLYLTADHGASENPTHLNHYGFPVRNYQNADVVAQLNDLIEARINVSNAVTRIINQYIYLSPEARPHSEAIALIAEQMDPFAHVYTAAAVKQGSADELITLFNMGYQSRAAGDLAFQLQPNAIFYGPYGSTHGTGYTYDTHVPFLMLGYGVSPGISYEKKHVTDIVDEVARVSDLPLAPNSLVR